MSVQEKMTAIADAIRSKTGKTETLGLDAMAAAVPEVYEAGKQDILAYHFKTEFVGDDTNAARIAIPFMPDMFEIVATSPLSVQMKDTYYRITAEPISSSRYSGIVGYVTSSGTLGTVSATTKSVQAAVSYENGVFSWYISALTALFRPNVRYFFFAVKYPGETAKSLVERDVALLPDAVPTGSTGTLEYNSARINSIFTSAEWAALIATKKNWTFSML